MVTSTARMDWLLIGGTTVCECAPQGRLLLQRRASHVHSVVHVGGALAVWEAEEEAAVLDAFCVVARLLPRLLVHAAAGATGAAARCRAGLHASKS